MNNRIKDTITAALVFVFGICVFLVSGRYPDVASTFPKVFGLILAGLSALLAASVWLPVLLPRLKKTGNDGGEKSDNAGHTAPSWRVAAIVALMVAYYFAFSYIGFLIPTFILVFAVSYILGYRRHLVNLLFSALLTGGMYLLMTLVFKVRF